MAGVESYQLETLLGSVYRKGNIAFLPTSGDTVLSPVGNRISGFDLKNNVATTISVQSSHNYVAMAISPNGKIVIAGNESGEIHVISLESKKLLHLFKTGEGPIAIKFSPNAKYFAILKESSVIIYEAPSALENTNPYYKKRVYSDFGRAPTSVDWSSDSKLIAIGTKENCVRVYPIEKYGNFTPVTLSGHSDMIVNVFFESAAYNLLSLSKNAQLFQWECSGTELTEFKEIVKVSNALSDDEIVDREKLETKKKKRGKRNKPLQTMSETNQDSVGERPLNFKKAARLYFSDLFEDKKRADLNCVDYNKTTKVLVTGFANGMFALHQLPEFTLLQILSIDEQNISTVSINKSGDWIAFGCSSLGQLLVWEWLSGTYILKQQSHFDIMNVCEYSPDGSKIATGGQDAKVKVWVADSSFCFATFTEHTSAITGIAFTATGNAILSSSLDGTVRAFDLTRYRNFRTLTTPDAAQFSCVSINSGGDLVGAGCTNLFDIFIWSLKTGHLLQALSSHTGPVSSLKFDPTPGSSQLASISWDKSLRVWDVLESATPNTTEFGSEITSLAIRPDGKELVIGTLNCELHFCKMDSTSVTEYGTIDGRNHLGGGRSDLDKITAKKSLLGKSFRCVTYSSDGSYVLAGGESKTICLYNAEKQLLVKKFEITQNKSLDGMNEFVHHRKLTEFGNMDLVEQRGDGDVVTLPGVRRGDMSSRTTKPEVRSSCINFSPAGDSFIVSTTEGVFRYAQGSKKVFMPSDSDESITPATIREALKGLKYDLALIMAMRLNIPQLCSEVIENIPVTHIKAICMSINYKYHGAFLKLLSDELGKSKHLEFFLMWIETFLSLYHMSWQKGKDNGLLSALTSIQKTVSRIDETSLANHNKYLVDYILRAGKNVMQVREEILDEEESVIGQGDEDEEMVIGEEDEEMANGVRYEEMASEEEEQAAIGVDEEMANEEQEEDVEESPMGEEETLRENDVEESSMREEETVRENETDENQNVTEKGSDLKPESKSVKKNGIGVKEEEEEESDSEGGCWEENEFSEEEDEEEEGSDLKPESKSIKKNGIGGKEEEEEESDSEGGGWEENDFSEEEDEEEEEVPEEEEEEDIELVDLTDD